MIYLILSLIVAVTVGALIFAVKYIMAREVLEKEISAELQELKARYKDVIDLEEFENKIKRDIALLQRQSNDETIRNQGLQMQADALHKQIGLYSDEQSVIDCGLYTPVYDYDISQKYKDELEGIRDQQKTVLKEKTAALCSKIFTMNGSASEGKKLTDHIIRLMLRAFNGESDSVIDNVRWNNVDKMVDRLEGVYLAINKLGEDHFVKIQRSYFQLKLKELHLSYEYEEKLKAEKDEQHRIQEQIREEERVRKEHERAIRDAEEEERRFNLALVKARQEAEWAVGQDKINMQNTIAELEQKLSVIVERKERSKSMAELTMQGYVYIISNIGSFGDNRFKIGLTRRENPKDRVDELGDASVPFEYDIHAMIFSDNAPKLESLLQGRFQKQRANLVNNRKEFFDISLDDLENALRDVAPSIEVTRIPAAKSYRQSLALRRQSVNGSSPHTFTTTVEKEVEQLVAQSTAKTVVQEATIPTETERPINYIYFENVKYGPFVKKQIQDALTAGQIDYTSLYWREGMADWAPVAEL